MSRPRKICYVTGTRADFGLMRSTLQLIQNTPELDLAAIVTGMHLSSDYGLTVDEIEAAGIPIAARVSVADGTPTGALMAKNIGTMLGGFADAMTLLQPDAVMVLGDRGEMLAGALAAAHLHVPVVHIHGGERSGTVDEPVRHAISKLSHFHLAATDESRDRLVRMGEAPDHVWVVGAPGLDGLKQLATTDRAALCREAGFDASRRVALLVYHPVLQEAERAGADTAAVVDALLETGLQIIAVKPNSDAGSLAVRSLLEERAAAGQLVLKTHLPRDAFVSWMAAADIMAGNSSSGIIEAATFGTPVVNIGTRQNLRQRNANIFDASVDGLKAVLARALAAPRFDGYNVYGDGKSGERIVALLKTIDLKGVIGAKVNVY